MLWCFFTEAVPQYYTRCEGTTDGKVALSNYRNPGQVLVFFLSRESRFQVLHVLEFRNLCVHFCFWTIYNFAFPFNNNAFQDEFGGDGATGDCDVQLFSSVW